MALSFFRFKVGFQHRASRMSAPEEIRTALDQIAVAAKGDFTPFVAALDDDLEVFDHVPYRFDNKSSFLEFIQRGMAGAESANFRAPSTLLSRNHRYVRRRQRVRSASYDPEGRRSSAGGERTHYAGASEAWSAMEDRERALFSNAQGVAGGADGLG
jgi:hypothetical protein